MTAPSPRDTRLFDAGAHWATEPTDRRGYGDALRDAVERATTPGDRDRGRELAERDGERRWDIGTALGWELEDESPSWVEIMRGIADLRALAVAQPGITREAVIEAEFVDELAADMCDQGRRPARTQYHHGAWNEVSRVDAEGYHERAAEIAAKVREHALSRNAPWFQVDLAADLVDACERPRRTRFSAAAWQRAKEASTSCGGTKAEWWLAYAEQIIARVLGEQ